jgi:capsular exopolysaccharide synthesis family protein
VASSADVVRSGPFTRSRPPRALVDPATASAASLRTLRLALQIRSDSSTGNTILFTSAEPGAGKSTVAANYSLIASTGQSVLLIDGDLRRPSLHRFFGLEQAPGLVDLLAAGSGIEHVARQIGPGNLRVMTAGSQISHVSDVASSERMRDLLRDAASDYDLVVVDAPPVLASADAEGLASHPGVDVVLVVKPSSKRRMILKALRRLELIEANIAGIVVNRAGRVSSYGGY